MAAKSGSKAKTKTSPADDKARAAIEQAVRKAAGMPHAHAVHIDPCTTAGVEQEPLPAALDDAAIARKSPAEWAYDRLILYIRNFEQQLDADQEIALGSAGSDAGVLTIEGLGFFEPDLVTFYGRDENGMKTQLIQHVTQLSVMLRAVPKEQTAEAPRRIGFRLSTGWRGGEAGDASAFSES